jgi:hypothetical protein
MLDVQTDAGTDLVKRDSDTDGGPNDVPGNDGDDSDSRSDGQDASDDGGQADVGEPDRGGPGDAEGSNDAHDSHWTNDGQDSGDGGGEADLGEPDGGAPGDADGSADDSIDVIAPLVTDTFTAANGTQLVGRAPSESNVPGDVYAGTGDPLWSTLIQGNAAELNADVGVSVSIASTASYTKPLTLTISASLNPQATTGTQGFRGVGLGYFAAPGGGNGFTGFTGLTLNPDGKLTLMENGTEGASVAYVGTWTANQMHSLSYSIDTRSGKVTNVVLDGQSKSYTTTAFTGSATTRAGFYVSGAAGGEKGLVDDFALRAGP